MIDVDYLVNSTPDHEETFVMDTLGNRTGNQTLTQGTVDFTVQSSTNRYTSIGGNTITHDFAGNMTTDKGGYTYEYDYENRIVKIEDSSSVEVATHDYDALGRRIRVIDKSADPDVTALYYHNPDWQVLAEYDGSNVLQRYFVYGNYIDEALVMNDATDDFYYVQDHLYSTVALIGYVDPAWVVVERCEYDAYGKMTRLDPDFTAWSGTEAGNPYYFTGRRLDVLDNGNLTKQHSRFRDYDTYTARFLQHDPIGYIDISNLYLYVDNCPVMRQDPYGLLGAGIAHWLTTKYIDDGPTKLEYKILSTLFIRIINGLNPVANLLQRIHNHYPFNDDHDQMDEMLRGDLDRYYADVVWHHRHFIYIAGVSGRWLHLSFPSPQPTYREWSPEKWAAPPGLGFWLGGPYDVTAEEGMLDVRHCEGRWKIKNVYAKYEWYDKIDANSVKELKEKATTGAAEVFLEGIIGDIIGDKILGMSYYTTIHFDDEFSEEKDVTSYVKNRH